MQLGIAGYRASGKTTVFNCLTGADASTGYGGAREANRGVIKVPDERVDKLSAIYAPKKTTYADITFVDLPGAEDDALDSQTAAELRRMDALVHVVRGFGGDGVPARNDKVDAARDIVDFDSELVLLDLMVLEGRIERLKKEGKKPRELDVLGEVVTAMHGGEKPVRVLGLDEATRASLSGYQLLSLKAQMALVNLDDDADAHDDPALVELAHTRGIEVMSMRPNIEREISQLPPQDQASFLEDLGLTETARTRFLRRSYAMLDLISFFTVGDDEVRAWTIKSGTPAVQAAGKIHSDLERGFIRAETVAYDDFIAHGKMSAVRQAGKLRLEGKDYVVKDGDILTIRFNV